MVNLLNSEFRDINTLLLLKDFDRAQKFESLFDQDEDFERNYVYSAENYIHSSNTLGNNVIDLVVLEENFSDKPHPFMLAEIKKISPHSKVVCCVNSLTIELVSESMKIGNLLDYSNLLESYDSLKSIIVSFMRKYNIHENLGYSKLSNALKIVNEISYNNVDVKLAKTIFNQLIPFYDISNKEISYSNFLIDIYNPSFSKDNYMSILDSSDTFLNKLACDLSSWQRNSDSPGSSIGFLITLCCYISSLLKKETSADDILQIIYEKKPSFLKHPSILSLDKEKLKDILINNKRIQIAA